MVGRGAAAHRAAQQQVGLGQRAVGDRDHRGQRAQRARVHPQPSNLWP